MVKVKVKVRLGYSCGYNLQKYMEIVHEHLRYAGLLRVDQLGFQKSDVVEFEIDVPRREHAKKVVERIKSFGDYAEIMEELEDG